MMRAEMDAYDPETMLTPAETILTTFSGVNFSHKSKHISCSRFLTARTVDCLQRKDGQTESAVLGHG
jgi:hypothetical protein